MVVLTKAEDGFSCLRVEDGADVEGVKGASRGERRGFVANIKGPVVKPYVSFDADAAI